MRDSYIYRQGVYFRRDLNDQCGRREQCEKQRDAMAIHGRNRITRKTLEEKLFFTTLRQYKRDV